MGPDSLKIFPKVTYAVKLEFELEQSGSSMQAFNHITGLLLASFPSSQRSLNPQPVPMLLSVSPLSSQAHPFPWPFFTIQGPAFLSSGPLACVLATGSKEPLTFQQPLP